MKFGFLFKHLQCQVCTLVGQQTNQFGERGQWCVRTYERVNQVLYICVGKCFEVLYHLCYQVLVLRIKVNWHLTSSPSRLRQVTLWCAIRYETPVLSGLYYNYKLFNYKYYVLLRFQTFHIILNYRCLSFMGDEVLLLSHYGLSCHVFMLTLRSVCFLIASTHNC